MPAPQGYSTRTLRDFVGHDFGASAPIAVEQELINTSNGDGSDKPALVGDVLVLVIAEGGENGSQTHGIGRGPRDIDWQLLRQGLHPADDRPRQLAGRQPGDAEKPDRPVRDRARQGRQEVQGPGLDLEPRLPLPDAELPGLVGRDHELGRRPGRARTRQTARQTAREPGHRRAGADQRAADQPDRDEGDPRRGRQEPGRRAAAFHARHDRQQWPAVDGRQVQVPVGPEPRDVGGQGGLCRGSPGADPVCGQDR